MRPNAFHGGLFESFVNRKNANQPPTQIISGPERGTSSRNPRSALQSDTETHQSICKSCVDLKTQKDNLMLELTQLRLKNDKTLNEKLSGIEKELSNQKGLVDQLEVHVQTLEEKQQALEVERAELLELVNHLDDTNKSLTKQLAHERQKLELIEEVKLDLDKNVQTISEERDRLKNLLLRRMDNNERIIFDNSLLNNVPVKNDFSTSLDSYLFDTNSASKDIADSELLEDNGYSKFSSPVSKTTIILNAKENFHQKSNSDTFKSFTGKDSNSPSRSGPSQTINLGADLSNSAQDFTISIPNPSSHNPSEIYGEPNATNPAFWDEYPNHHFIQDKAYEQSLYKIGREVSSPNFDNVETSTCASTPGDQKIIENSNFSKDELLRIVSPIAATSKIDLMEHPHYHHDSTKQSLQEISTSDYDHNTDSNNIEYILENIAEYLASHCIDDSDNLIEYPSLNALTYPIDKVIINKSASYLIEWSTSTSFLNRFSLNQTGISLNLFLFKYLSHVNKFLESLVSSYNKNAYNIQSNIHQQIYTTKDSSEAFSLNGILKTIQNSLQSSEIEEFRLTQECIMQIILSISDPLSTNELEKELINFFCSEQPYLNDSNIAHIGKLVGKIIFTTSSAMKYTYLEFATIIFFISELENNSLELKNSNKIVFQTLKNYIKPDLFYDDLENLQEIVSLSFQNDSSNLNISNTLGNPYVDDFDMIKLDAIKFSIQLFSNFFGFFWVLQYPLNILMDYISCLPQINKGHQMCFLAAIEGLVPQSTLNSETENLFLANIDKEEKYKLKFSFFSIIAVYDKYCKENTELLNDLEASITTIETLTNIFEQFEDQLGFE